MDKLNSYRAATWLLLVETLEATGARCTSDTGVKASAKGTVIACAKKAPTARVVDFITILFVRINDENLEEFCRKLATTRWFGYWRADLEERKISLVFGLLWLVSSKITVMKNPNYERYVHMLIWDTTYRRWVDSLFREREQNSLAPTAAYGSTLRTPDRLVTCSFGCDSPVTVTFRTRYVLRAWVIPRIGFSVCLSIFMYVYVYHLSSIVSFWFLVCALVRMCGWMNLSWFHSSLFSNPLSNPIPSDSPLAGRREDVAAE